MSYYSYTFCSQGSIYYDTFGTEEDAFDAAVFEASADPEKKPFYISLFHPVTPKWSTTAADIVAEISENLADESKADCVEVLADEEEIRALERSLDACINEWFKKYNIGAGYSLTSWTKRFIWDKDAGSYVEDLDYVEGE